MKEFINDGPQRRPVCHPKKTHDVVDGYKSFPSGVLLPRLSVHVVGIHPGMSAHACCCTRTASGQQHTSCTSHETSTLMQPPACTSRGLDCLPPEFFCC